MLLNGMSIYHYRCGLAHLSEVFFDFFRELYPRAHFRVFYSTNRDVRLSGSISFVSIMDKIGSVSRFNVSGLSELSSALASGLKEKQAPVLAGTSFVSVTLLTAVQCIVTLLKGAFERF